jgi:hypothetical protein
MSILNNKWEGVNLAMLIIISASLILSAAVSAAPVVAAKQYIVKSIGVEDGEDAKSEETELAKDDNDDKSKDGEDAKSEETELAKDDNDDKSKDGDAKSEETELTISCNSDEEADDNSTEDSDVPCDELSASTEALNATTTTMSTAPVSVF